MRLIKKTAKTVIAEKRRNEEDTAKKRETVNFIRLWRMKRNEIQKKKIIARKDERTRLKRVKKFMKQNIMISNDLVRLIVDSKVEWKAINEVWRAEKAKKIVKRRKIEMKSQMSTIVEQRERNEEDNEIEDTEFILSRDLMKTQDDFISFVMKNDEFDDEFDDEYDEWTGVEVDHDNWDEEEIAEEKRLIESQKNSDNDDVQKLLTRN